MAERPRPASLRYGRIYYSGHGDSQASYFYLLTADSKENRYADTALRADYVLEALGETPRCAGYC